MKLVRVERTANRIMETCCKCGQRFRELELYADLAGTPFTAYYCELCADIVAPDQVDGLYTYAQHNSTQGANK